MSERYPFASHYFDRAGLKLHYLDEGQHDSEPMVMVHGNPTWSYYYRNLVLAFRDKYRCIVPDHVGCGLSDKPSLDRYDYSLKSRIDDLEAFLESLQLTQKITLVVHDWGGMIGMGYAVRHPEKIGRLVILNTAAFHLPESKKFPIRLWLGRNTWLGRWLIRSRNLFVTHAANIGVKRKPLPQDVRAEYLRPYDSWDNRIAIWKFVQTIPLKSRDPGYSIVSGIQASLPKFQSIPKLIFWGMKDFVFDRHFLAEWERYFPNAEVHRFPKAGHYVLEDEQTEIIEKMRAFLQKPS